MYARAPVVGTMSLSQFRLLPHDWSAPPPLSHTFAADATPANRRSLAVSLGKAADANLKSRQNTLARQQCAESLKILDELVAAEDDWLDASADLAAVVFTFAEIERHADRTTEAKKHYARTVSILRGLESKGLLGPKSKYRAMLTLAEQRLKQP